MAILSAPADEYSPAQIMWASTTHIGCARTFGIAQPYKVFDVCRFYPEGNILGQKPF
ncbi:unnamed protein product [Clonostachys rhizophaga]|uniref:Uncharacterized protein n=1 Tax=Clonostachys rhizophaga TaxID=160324 RepID=A0A9N9VRM5_9HYPO|nr:unnamed protein product [Clonostachys rhizophaga]